MKVDRMQMGATIDGIERRPPGCPGTAKLTRATRASEMPMVIQTSWIASAVNTELSIADDQLRAGGQSPG